MQFCIYLLTCSMQNCIIGHCATKQKAIFALRTYTLPQHLGQNAWLSGMGPIVSRMPIRSGPNPIHRSILTGFRDHTTLEHCLELTMRIGWCRQRRIKETSVAPAIGMAINVAESTVRPAPIRHGNSDRSFGPPAHPCARGTGPGRRRSCPRLIACFPSGWPSKPMIFTRSASRPSRGRRRRPGPTDR